jgi:hypothetical protein
MIEFQPLGAITKDRRKHIMQVTGKVDDSAQDYRHKVRADGFQ